MVLDAVPDSGAGERDRRGHVLGLGHQGGRGLSEITGVTYPVAEVTACTWSTSESPCRNSRTSSATRRSAIFATCASPIRSASNRIARLVIEKLPFGMKTPASASRKGLSGAQLSSTTRMRSSSSSSSSSAPCTCGTVRSDTASCNEADGRSPRARSPSASAARIRRPLAC